MFKQGAFGNYIKATQHTIHICLISEIITGCNVCLPCGTNFGIIKAGDNCLKSDRSIVA